MSEKQIVEYNGKDRGWATLKSAPKVVLPILGGIPHLPVSAADDGRPASVRHVCGPIGNGY